MKKDNFEAFYTHKGSIYTKNGLVEVVVEVELEEVAIDKIIEILKEKSQGLKEAKLTFDRGYGDYADRALIQGYRDPTIEELEIFNIARELKKKQKLEAKKESEARQKAEYERLKKKFEGKGSKL